MQLYICCTLITNFYFLFDVGQYIQKGFQNTNTYIYIYIYNDFQLVEAHISCVYGGVLRPYAI